jgi:cobalt-zinc-cadmium efflux system outer membrane protein
MKHTNKWRNLASCLVGVTTFASIPSFVLAQVTEAPVSIPQSQAGQMTWANLVEAAFARTAAGADAEAASTAAGAQTALAGRRVPGTFEVDGSVRQDIIGSGKGYREVEAGVTASLWRRGEREGLRGQSAGLMALAARQSDVAKLEVAGQVRAAWWAYERATAEVGVLAEQVRLNQELASNIERLVAAGEMARLDLLQAQAANGEVVSRLALAESAKAQARAALEGLIGGVPNAMPMEAPGALELDNHPSVVALRAEAETLDKQARLVRLQAGPAWRVGLDVRAERGLSGDNTLTSTGVRVARPFGVAPSGGVEATGLQARATAALTRASAQKLAIEGARNQAVAQLAGARTAQASAQARQELAAQALALTLKGRAEGELSFFEELRARGLLADAQRAYALTRVEIGAAMSQFNQAQGLLP